jgi:hypothetical protein
LIGSSFFSGTDALPEIGSTFTAGGLLVMITRRPVK